MPLIGAHVSTAGGLVKAAENAKRIGAVCLQIFGASPRQWQAKLPAKEDIRNFQQALEKNSLGPVYLHATYLVNLATPESSTRKKSISNLIVHLQIAELLGADGLIFHPGSGKGLERHKALRNLVTAMAEVLKRVPGKSQLIIENTAGGGYKIGAAFEEIGSVLKALYSRRVKVCFDTAHAFEAGLINEYSPPKIKAFFDEWEKTIGPNQLVVIHANDSKTVFNSHHDQHENIGQGKIGKQGFVNLAKEKRVRNLPWILEVPGFDDQGPDKKNVDILKSCF